ncbi:hypothetical protein FRC08_000828, partial [Ceratobasidium sp. 394]
FTVFDIQDTNTGRHISSVPYSGEFLRDCRFDGLKFHASFITYEVTIVIGPIVCYISRGVTVLFQVGKTIGLESISRNSVWGTSPNITSGPIADVLHRIEQIYDLDVIDSVLLKSLAPSDDFGVTNDSISSFHVAFDPKSGSELECLGGHIMFRSSSPVICHTGNSTNGAGLGHCIRDPSAISAINNYLRIMWSSHLMYLGTPSNSNVLTDAKLMETKISNLSLPIPPGYFFHWPLPPVERTQFNMVYRCRFLKWKSPSLLFVDVTVATVSLFMAYWSGLNMLLTYIVKVPSDRSE